jgi:hypothetical protein
MTDEKPPTFTRPLPPKVAAEEPIPRERPAEAGARSVGHADAEPTMETLVSASESAREQQPLRAASTLVWLAYSTLQEIAQGAPSSAAEWRATKVVLESALRYLVLDRAQCVVDGQVSHSSGNNTGLVDILRRLSSLCQGRGPARDHEAREVWRVARRIDLAAQCLHDWTTKLGQGVSLEEVGALARELQFVYQDLQPMMGTERETREA